MSGGCRQSESLVVTYRLQKWRGVRRVLSGRWWKRHEFWLDNIGPIKCWLRRGHDRYNTACVGERPDYACHRCGRYVP